MATLVCFHAHPDDETIATGGTIARAVAEGHRVVLVLATRGERGEVDEGVLAPGEELWQRRVAELEEAARILGAHRVAYLGYGDSGMAGEPSNDDPGCFWQADIEEAAARLARLLEEEAADVLTVYDDNGGYGHPDHVQVHRVGVRAAELAGTPRVYEATMDRDRLRAMMEMAPPEGMEAPPDFDVEQFGVPGAQVTTRVDVRDRCDVKRKAMAAHASQIGETSFFLAMPPEVFPLVFGEECFVRRGAPAGTVETGLFEGLA
jgi:LmbE family N-acetylglucosaminyl deacetylase